MSDLDQALDQWLQPGPPRIDPKYPAVLEALYAGETAGAKLRSLRISTAIGTIAGLILTFPLWLVFTDEHRAIGVVWLGMAMPVALLSNLLLWTRLPVRVQEGHVAVLGLFCALCLSIIMLSTAVPEPSFYLGAMLLLIMLDVTAGGFNVRLGASFAGLIALMFAVTIQRLPRLGEAASLIDTGLMALCSISAVLGTWRVETATRLSWALMLRERLKQHDLTSQNSELAELARRDPLTGLANRRAYEMAEQASWRVAAASSVPVGLVVLDIDHFKSYNDFYGHPAGDMCLQAVARCLSEQSRGAGDMVARVGGEEFAILLPDLTVETAGDIAERVRRAIADLELPHLGCGVGRIVTVSCGACSLVPRPGATPKDLFAAADAALYAAKQAGRNRVCLADQLVFGPADKGASRVSASSSR